MPLGILVMFDSIMELLGGLDNGLFMPLGSPKSPLVLKLKSRGMVHTQFFKFSVVFIDLSYYKKQVDIGYAIGG